MFRLTALVLSAGLLIGVSLQRPLQAEEAGRRIAIVNVSQVFTAYQKVKDVQEKMQKLFETERNSLEAEGRALKSQEEAIRLDPRDPQKDVEFFKEVQKFELAKMEWTIKGNALQQRVEVQKKEQMKQVLTDIRNAIRTIGTGEYFDLVLRAPEFDDEFNPDKSKAEQNEQQSAADLVRKFRENPVMYFSQGVDITAKVITRLNDDYKTALETTK